jgi:transcriptional regulator with XRE-family HTH domain
VATSINSAKSASQLTADPALGIGVRLAGHRAQRGVRVSALAREIGVSPSLISQIERGHSRPSVSTLFALAEALGISVDAFFRDEHGTEPPAAPARPPADPPAGAAPPTRDSQVPAATPAGRGHRYVVRRAERPTIEIEGGVRWGRLTPAPLDTLEFMELEYGPHAESNPTQYRHPGMEMLLVLAGRLDISIDSEQYELAAGDSICFPSTRPHRYVNPTGDVVRAVTVILPDETAPGPANDRRT